MGRVGIRILTDPAGAVSNCTVEESSGSAILDKQTCDIMRQRAKFKPALDQQGKAVAGEFRQRIEWQIAEDRLPSDPWVSRTIITFAPDGQPLSCRMELEGAMKPPSGTAPPDCSAEDIAAVPRKMADLPEAVGTLILEQSFAKRRIPPPPVPAGDVLVSRQVMSLAINKNGHLTSCKVIERSGAGKDTDACATIEEEYVPRPGPDGWPMAFTAIETVSVYVRVEKVAIGASAARGVSGR
jgi:TonB family protein